MSSDEIKQLLAAVNALQAKQDQEAAKAEQRAAQSKRYVDEQMHKTLAVVSRASLKPVS